MRIAIDFDGTCVKHAYPKIGADIGAVPILQELIEDGHQLILFTMRSDEGLEEAINWFDINGIELYGIQADPNQTKWTDSPKAYAHLYIDDAALGCPLIHEDGRRPYVDWIEVRNELIRKRIL